MTTPLLAAEALSFAYTGETHALSRCSAQFQAGRLTCLLGPNGAGKTTLLRCLLGFLRPSAGRILLRGRNLASLAPKELARHMAYVPQSLDQSSAFTVREAVMTGRLAHTGALGLTGENDRQKAAEALAITGSTRFENRLLSELSGGEAQCVMLARALAQEPEILLLDEPASHLDIGNQTMTYKLLRQLARERDMAVICVGHDINQALRYADDLAFLRAGRVEAAGPAAETADMATLERVYGIKLEPLLAPDGTSAGIRVK